VNQLLDLGRGDRIEREHGSSMSSDLGLDGEARRCTTAAAARPRGWCPSWRAVLDLVPQGDLRSERSTSRSASGTRMPFRRRPARTLSRIDMVGKRVRLLEDHADRGGTRTGSTPGA
jgi:hypothetical protein